MSSTVWVRGLVRWILLGPTLPFFWVIAWPLVFSVSTAAEATEFCAWYTRIVIMGDVVP